MGCYFLLLPQPLLDHVEIRLYWKNVRIDLLISRFGEVDPGKTEGISAFRRVEFQVNRFRLETNSSNKQSLEYQHI